MNTEILPNEDPSSTDNAAASQKNIKTILRQLESDGIISRKVYAEVPPRVEYAMTEKGLTLRPIIFAMRDWGLEFGADNMGCKK